MRLDGSVVIVTGGASGLGAGSVEHLRDAGARIAIFDKSEIPSSSLGERVKFYAVDIADEASVVGGMEAVKADFGAIHAVVNCAGIVKSHPLYGDAGRYPTELFNRIVAVNLTGTFLVMAHAIERMTANEPNEDGERGVIVNTASIAALDGSSSVGYAASKGGVVSMSLTAARDVAPYGIRINAIAPGYMDTNMFAGLEETYRQKLVSGTVFPKRLGKAREFGALAGHIIENAYINATTFRFDAGARV